jgi:aspartokinase
MFLTTLTTAVAFFAMAIGPVTPIKMFALRVNGIIVWKDVEGILSMDPGIVVPHGVPLDQVSFEEASELAYCDAQVLHPIAMKPAMKYNVPSE